MLTPMRIHRGLCTISWLPLQRYGISDLLLFQSYQISLKALESEQVVSAIEAHYWSRVADRDAGDLGNAKFII